MWKNWINAILGLWVIAVPFLGFMAATLTWVLVVTGIVVAVLGVWAASEESADREHMVELEHRLAHRS